MPTLTQPHETHERPGIVLAYDLGVVPIYKGALVGLTPAGKLAPLSPETPMRFLGVSAETGDPAKGARRVTLVKLGSCVFGCARGFAPSAADLGRLVYAASDWEVTPYPTDLTHATPVGTIVGVESVDPAGSRAPGVRIRIDLHTV